MISRREFIGRAGLAGTVLALEGRGALPVVAPTVAFRRILLARGSARPVQTAARELAAYTGAAVDTRDHPAGPATGDIVLAAGREVECYPAAARRLSAAGGEGEWELNLQTDAGLMIAGAEPRNVCRAALGWIANSARETNRLSRYEAEERFCSARRTAAVTASGFAPRRSPKSTTPGNGSGYCRRAALVFFAWRRRRRLPLSTIRPSKISR